MGSPSSLPVARHPNPIAGIVVIGGIISIRRIIGTKVNRRGWQKNGWCKK